MTVDRATTTPAALMPEARELLARLDGESMPAFIRRFGTEVLDLALDGGEDAARAVAGRLALIRAIPRVIPTTDLLVELGWHHCPHAVDAQTKITSDLIHRTVYCEDCAADYTGIERVLDTGCCDCCGEQAQERRDVSVYAGSAIDVAAYVCSSCAGYLEIRG